MAARKQGAMTPTGRLEFWLKMQALNPRGFRDAPTSPKNPRFHSAKPTTMIEKLVREAGIR